MKTIKAFEIRSKRVRVAEPDPGGEIVRAGCSAAATPPLWLPWE